MSFVTNEATRKVIERRIKALNIAALHMQRKQIEHELLVTKYRSEVASLIQAREELEALLFK